MKAKSKAILFLMAFILCGADLHANWVKVIDGVTPSGARLGGKEPNGSPLYIARANYGGGIHLGKARRHALQAYIPYGGQEKLVNDYEVYVGTGTWEWVSTPGIVANAIVGGKDNDGTPLYIARAYHEGSFHPGKLRKGGKMYFSYGGKEIEKTANYQVLVAENIGDPVTVYQDCDFDNYYKGFNVGVYPNLSSQQFNNNISSIRVKEGFEVVLFDLENFQGAKEKFEGYAFNNCLAVRPAAPNPKGEIRFERNADFNDRASSMWVFPKNRVVFFQSCNNDRVINLFQAGDYPKFDFAFSPLTVGAMYCTGSFKITFYRETNFNGSSYSLFASDYFCFSNDSKLFEFIGQGTVLSMKIQYIP